MNYVIIICLNFPIITRHSGGALLLMSGGQNIFREKFYQKLSGGNMREIKFRAWDKDKKKMFHHANGRPLIIYGKGLWCIWIKDKPLGERWVTDHDSAILMQYTGLRDSTKWEQLTEKEQERWLDSGKTKKEWNGKEIYEGDILKTPADWGDKGIVEWDDDMAGFFVTVNDCGGHMFYEDFEAKDVEVIGNIYEMLASNVMDR